MELVFHSKTHRLIQHARFIRHIAYRQFLSGPNGVQLSGVDCPPCPLPGCDLLFADHFVS